MNIIRKIDLKWLLALVGAVGGFLYWKFVGCSTGSCPIQQNWILSTLWGAAIGYLLSDLFKPKKSNTDENQELK